MAGSGVSQGEENMANTSLTSRRLLFEEVRTSHAGRYVCVGKLESVALDEPLVKTAEYSMELTSE